RPAVGGDHAVAGGGGDQQVVGEAAERAHAVQHLLGDDGGEGHVEAEHLHRPAGLEDDRGGLRVGEHVELGGRVVVAAGVGAAHDDEVAGPLHDPRLLPYGQRDVGERPDRDERDLAGGGAQGVDDEVHGVPVGGGADRFGEHGVAQAGGSVHVPGADHRVEQGAGAAGGDRDVAQVQELAERQRVPGGHGQVGVAAHGGDGDDLQAGGAGGEGEGHGVVDAGVAVDEDLCHESVRYARFRRLTPLQT